MATPKLTTTIDERAAAIATRKFRVHASGETARVAGSKPGKFYDVSLVPFLPSAPHGTCTCLDFTTRYFRANKNWDALVAGVRPVDYVCKHIARLRAEHDAE